MSGSATVKLLVDEHGERAVVTQADDQISIARDLWEMMRDPVREGRIKGDFEITQGEEILISFGTPGEGLGRVTYRVVERLTHLVLCERVPDLS